MGVLVLHHARPVVLAQVVGPDLGRLHGDHRPRRCSDGVHVGHARDAHREPAVVGVQLDDGFLRRLVLKQPCDGLVDPLEGFDHLHRHDTVHARLVADAEVGRLDLLVRAQLADQCEAVGCAHVERIQRDSPIEHAQRLRVAAPLHVEQPQLDHRRRPEGLALHRPLQQLRRPRVLPLLRHRSSHRQQRRRLVGKPLIESPQQRLRLFVVKQLRRRRRLQRQRLGHVGQTRKRRRQRLQSQRRLVLTQPPLCFEQIPQNRLRRRIPRRQLVQLIQLAHDAVERVEIEPVDSEPAPEEQGFCSPGIELQRLLQRRGRLGPVVLVVENLRLSQQRRPVQAVQLRARLRQELQHEVIVVSGPALESRAQRQRPHSLDQLRGAGGLRARQLLDDGLDRCVGLLTLSQQEEGLRAEPDRAGGSLTRQRLDRPSRLTRPKQRLRPVQRIDRRILKQRLVVDARQQRRLRPSSRVLHIRCGPPAVEDAQVRPLLLRQVRRLQQTLQRLGGRLLLRQLPLHRRADHRHRQNQRRCASQTTDWGR